jgi:hypothetical protein
MGIDLDSIEKLMKILVFLVFFIILVAILLKLNQFWGFLTNWRNAFSCWAFGSHC